MVPSSSSALGQQTQQIRERVDTALSAYTDLPRDCPPQLRDAIRHSLLSPGKRLRPLLVVLACEACGGTQQAAVPAACAVEMVHAYSLIHDDLPAMDDDDLRRGRPSCHKAFGEAEAILAGDALLTLAFEVIARDVKPPETAAHCAAVLARAAGATGMVGGQADDLASEATPSDLETLESIHRRKTAALFLASLQMGGLIADADAEQIEALTAYGNKLGLAFQITDDLLDVGGSEQTVGKRVGKDSQRGKLTFPRVVGAEESAARAERLIDEACAALDVFGSTSGRLEALARYILERNL